MNTKIFCIWVQNINDNQKLYFEKRIDPKTNKMNLVKSGVLLNLNGLTFELFYRSFKPKCGNQFSMPVFYTVKQ